MTTTWLIAASRIGMPPWGVALIIMVYAIGLAAILIDARMARKRKP